MQNVFFISDTHFSHTNVLEYEKIARPFKSLDEHDAVLIDNWNKTVRDNDIVFHLGDFCMGGKKNVEIASQLNGRKRLVMGNHDCYGVELYAKHFEKIFGATFYKEFLLTHIPVYKVPATSVNVHGHLHSKMVEIFKIDKFDDEESIRKIPDPEYFCVSVEQINLTPIHIDELREKIKARNDYE